MRAEPNRFLVYRLNHSATTADGKLGSEVLPVHLRKNWLIDSKATCHTSPVCFIKQGTMYILLKLVACFCIECNHFLMNNKYFLKEDLHIYIYIYELEYMCVFYSGYEHWQQEK